MKKRGEAALYVFLAFAAIAGIGLTYTILTGTPEGMAYRGPSYQDMPLNPTQFPSYYEQYGNGMIPTSDQPGLYKIGTPGSVSDCQSSCFGTEPGRPRIGQETLGGAELRSCLADCQQGIPYHKQSMQECYTCSGVQHGITADDHNQATTVCKQVGGSSAVITNAVPGMCDYG